MATTPLSTFTSFTKEDLKLIDELLGEGQIDSEYRCFLCARIMLDVSQADDCGCRYCSDCLEQM